MTTRSEATQAARPLDRLVMPPTLLNGDCLDLMGQIPDGSVDMILCDLPYGTTACKWDTVIPFEPLWKHYKRVIKKNGVIVLFGSQPFTTMLIASNIGMFKYELVWEKNFSTNFLHASRQPLKKHENLVCFYQKPGSYYPIKTTGHMPTQSAKGSSKGRLWHGENKRNYSGGETTRHPTSILRFNAVDPKLRSHPTQKPVALCEYLIRTYTNEGETVLDNCMGSGTTSIACLNTGRNFIGIEKDPKYFEIARNRIMWHNAGGKPTDAAGGRSA